MSMTTVQSPQNHWRARFLLDVQVETAPAELLYDALGELRALLAPIATSNRAFLNAITDILRRTTDTELNARGAGPVQTGLIFDDIERDLDRAIVMIRAGDVESVFVAARIAQAWGWLAMRLRDELNDLAVFVTGSSAPLQTSAVGQESREGSGAV
ncbi:hypothetical protein [Paracoccus sp. ME4]|uniref:hypothetical protein n=1 Tax=Paracoccus sp. ME4 TaxID=3138066 RepID=UPI00398B095A